MDGLEIIPYQPVDRDAVLALTAECWTPVFARTSAEVPRFVYDAFYPDGWQLRQRADVGALLDADPGSFRLAMLDGTLAGFVGLTLHPEDQMGEVVIVAVAPRFQRRGIGRVLIAHAEQVFRDAGLVMSMVETVGDSGHAPARATYEASGYVPWPVARYFKPL